MNSFQDAVFLDVQGGGPLSRLHERFFDLAALPTLPSYPYLPHCTIAHYDGTTPHEEAQRCLLRGETRSSGSSPSPKPRS